MVACIHCIPAEAKALPCEGGISTCGVMLPPVCLHHIGCFDCIAGNTASTRSEPPQQMQLPFTGQSHTASSDSSHSASSNQPATSHTATGPSTAGVGSSSSSSSSTRLGTASEPTQLSGRSQAGRVTQACSSLLSELHVYGHNVVLDVTSCRTAYSTHPGCQGLDEMTC